MGLLAAGFSRCWGLGCWSPFQGDAASCCCSPCCGAGGDPALRDDRRGAGRGESSSAVWRLLKRASRSIMCGMGFARTTQAMDALHRRPMFWVTVVLRAGCKCGLNDLADRGGAGRFDLRFLRFSWRDAVGMWNAHAGRLIVAGLRRGDSSGDATAGNLSDLAVGQTLAIVAPRAWMHFSRAADPGCTNLTRSHGKCARSRLFGPEWPTCLKRALMGGGRPTAKQLEGGRT